MEKFCCDNYEKSMWQITEQQIFCHNQPAAIKYSGAKAMTANAPEKNKNPRCRQPDRAERKLIIFSAMVEKCPILPY